MFSSTHLRRACGQGHGNRYTLDPRRLEQIRDYLDRVSHRNDALARLMAHVEG